MSEEHPEEPQEESQLHEEPKEEVQEESKEEAQEESQGESQEESKEESEKITVTTNMDLQGSQFIYTQTTEKSVKTLKYDYKRCNGCGICVEICPTKALEAGPIHEIATGLDAPAVMMDLDKCTFCRMCANLCPVHAISFEATGEVQDEEQYPKYDSYVSINEKCLPCALCEKTCPQEAIELEFTFPKKEEIAPFKEGAEGEIEIDTEKCNFCGICAHFCEAFILLEREPTPTNLVPFEQLLVDEDKCDYCVLCQDICPEEAIKVKGERPCEAPKVEGQVKIDDLKCTRCGRCQAVCPYEAVDLKKPMEGELSLVEANLKECDPQGCRGCFNVCPSKLWYVPTDPEDPRKIAFAGDYCTYCGACVKACHLAAIKLERTDVHHTEIPDAPWAAQWRDAIESLKTGVRKGVDRAVARETEVLKAQKFLGVNPPEVDQLKLEAVQARLEPLIPTLKSAKVRKLWEKDTAENALEAVKKKIESQEKSKAENKA